MKPFKFQILASACLLILNTACESPFAPEKQSSIVPSDVKASPTGIELSSPAAKKAKMNAELFHEMTVVIFMREPKDRSEFGNWVDTLNQGASLEGVYNGLTHSADYEKLENSSPKASEKSVKIFREEITILEAELPKATELGNFGLASIFLLKRVLCDEALKVIADKEPSRDKLASWYSKWVVRMTQRNIDFGIPLRNKADESFHFKWATEVTTDQVRWEVLNRLQRVLNDANK